MKEKRLTFSQGKGSISHNNREFVANNVDLLRTPDNITFIAQPIAEAYDQLFRESTERYNAKQTRNDRKISNYYEHLFGCKPCSTIKVNALDQKSFYEVIVQVGKKEDTGIGTGDDKIAAEILKEYMEGFQKRNPNFYVFNAVLHMDEATPHLHFDYIPVGHYKRGQDTQNGIAQALKEMGWGGGKMAIARWRDSETEVLNNICREHGIEPLPPEESRGTLEVEEYKEQRRKADALAAENVQVSAELNESKSELEKITKKKVDIEKIENIEVKESVFGKKVTLSRENYDKLNDAAKKYVAMEKNTKKLRKERDNAVQECIAVKKQLETVSSELSVYKKKEENSHCFTREKLNAESRRIKREEQLNTDLQKAKAFISACGLADEFEHYRNNRHRSSELE
ncbi:plasmid recombination protein [Ruminococcus sp. HUN007]|uniref:plasmid recombination protein n=1 Tax=Ruminococcus sp. HUN007 TaxID=1514668 RepID=UPI0005D2495E|nr:plasmid recombination protein [Ruminococcus sp. HUN007]